MAPSSATDSARMPSQLRWADEHPLALQERADPTILLAAAPSLAGWELAAGWVPIVNRLHAGQVELLGEHRVVRAGNKMSALRYAIDAPRQQGAGPGARSEANRLLLAARQESLRTCDLCGGPAEGQVSRGTTRCAQHLSTRERRCPERGPGRRAGWERGRGSGGGRHHSAVDPTGIARTSRQ